MPHENDIRTSRRRTLAVTTVFIASFLVMLDLSISAIILPAIRFELHAGLSELQWFFDAYTLCFASLVLVGGTISDRLGHRAGLLVSIATFTVGSVMCAVADNVGLLIAGRAVQGVAAALLVPGAMAMISHLAGDQARRARLLGAWGGLSGAAIAFGPPLGGWLTDAFGWRSIFWINVPLGIVVAVLVAVLLPRPPAGARTRFDWPGMLLGVAAVLLLAFAVIEGRSFGWTSPVIVGCLVGSVLAAVAFVVVERRVANPMVDLALFRDRAFGTASVAGFVLGFGLSTSFYFLSLYLQQVLGFNALSAGLGFMPAAVALSVAAGVTGKLMPTVGPRVLLVAGLAVGAVGLVGLSFAGPRTSYLVLVPAVLLIGVGWGLALPVVTAVALASSPPERAGVASGTVETSLQLGTVIGIAALGTLQAARFVADLTDRLAGQVSAADLSGVIDAIVNGRDVTVAGWSTEQLTTAVTSAFGAGTGLAFLVAGVTTAVVAAIAFVGTPRRLPDAQPQPSPTEEHASA
ncbi:MFS transporter [Luedemannella helvata]|uniref:MFS transporter n=1 Tax=Luedemannella helvata TaxID=349315 RepID=A0ABP4X1F7_9ACTN